MKQISTGTGLVVLSGTILASVFLSSPRTATTAFASAQQAQPAERGVGRTADAVALGGACESQIWFNTQPREFVESCDPYRSYFRFGDQTWSDVNGDGKVESFTAYYYGS